MKNIKSLILTIYLSIYLDFGFRHIRLMLQSVPELELTCVGYANVTVNTLAVNVSAAVIVEAKSLKD